MLVEFLTFIESIVMPLNFACHLVIFLGGLYIALKSKNLPTWLSTPLWYIGLSAALNVIVILIDWVMGPMFPFAYTQISTVTETILNVWLAVTVGVFSYHTISDVIKKK